MKGRFLCFWSKMCVGRAPLMVYHRLMDMDFSFGRSETHIAGARLLRGDRSPCPVCGDPNGDCSGESSPPTKIWGLGGVPSMEDEQTVYVEKDIIEERQISPFTKSKVLVAAAGSQIPLSKARELGLL